MKKTIWIIIALIFTFLTAIVGLEFKNRFALPYNSNGNYFDKTTTIVYHAQSVFVYGLITFILFLIALFLAYFASKK
ncbi:MAG: hypothetical protein JXR51_16275 [Bacteroidales bacterium]|nr:hypothetical protein [Bacteroidales bacterium]MBN2758723.1 hypothetical protein [Bacteroidales bacterium]